METIGGTGLMILTVLAGSEIAGEEPCSPTRLWTDSTRQRWDMGYINYKPEYEEIAGRWPGTPRDRIVEISRNVLRICAGGTPMFP
jgi:hypothetical protein